MSHQPIYTDDPSPTSNTVSVDDYLDKYAHTFYEWVDGTLINLRPFTLKQLRIADFVRAVLDCYFSLNQIGQTIGIPFLLRLDGLNAMREPDLMVILQSCYGQLTDTAMIGPADIVIEVVSPESVARDYGDKYQEYEKAMVKEYWIIDPIREETRFNRLNDKGIFVTILPDGDGYYETPLLPGLRVHVPTLWAETLPNFFEIGEAVKSMLNKQ